MSLTTAFQRFSNLNIVRIAVHPANRLLRTLGPFEFKIENQSVFANSVDRVISLALLRSGGSEDPELSLWRQVCGPGMTVADVGSNLGLYAFVAAECVGQRGRVIAIEAAPDNADLIRLGCKRNGYRNIDLVQAAAAERSGEVELAIRDEHRGDHQIANTSSTRRRIKVAAVTLDELVGRPAKIDRIKIDVQGAEALVIKGMNQILKDSPQLIVFSEFWPKGLSRCGMRASDYLAFWRDAGFDIFEIVSRSRLRLVDDEALASRYGSSGYTNLVISRDRHYLANVAQLC